VKKSKDALKAERILVLKNELQSTIAMMAPSTIPITAQLKKVAVNIHEHPDHNHVEGYIHKATMSDCESILKVLSETNATHSEKIISELAPIFVPVYGEAKNMLHEIEKALKTVSLALVTSFNNEFHTGTQMIFKQFEIMVKDRLKYLEGVQAGMAAAASKMSD